ncbi:hypothetical protein PMAYCL1PPCAC_01481, partial [Pristionchus mayeri]
SENPSNLSIFFKDKQHVLKGPFTERKIQEWYRKKLFEGSFLFCVLIYYDSNQLRSKTDFLDELCSRNGIGSPFSIPSESPSLEKNRDQAEQRLHCIEEKIRSLRVKCDEVMR